jgi:hypothetical protein
MESQHANVVADTKWKDKSNIFLIFTEFEDTVDITNKRGQTVKKTKGKQQIPARYRTPRSHACMLSLREKTIQRYKKIAIHIFQMMMNAHNLHCRYTEKQSLHDFRFCYSASVIFIHY